MDSEPPLDYLLDPPGTTAPPTAGRDELSAIVGRSRHRQRRLAATGMALTLALGAAGGWLVRSRGSSSTTVAGGTLSLGPAANAAVPEAFAASGTTVAAFPSVEKLYVRTTHDGVTLRVYTDPSYPTTFPSASTPPPGCGPVVADAGIVVEVSTAAIATPSPRYLQEVGGAIKGYVASVLGVVEGAPVWVVTAKLGNGVAKAMVTFPDGATDSMSVVDGWVTLARIAPQGTKSSSQQLGILQALDNKGKVLASTGLSNSGQTIMPLPFFGDATMPPAGSNVTSGAASASASASAGTGGSASAIARGGSTGSVSSSGPTGSVSSSGSGSASVSGSGGSASTSSSSPGSAPPPVTVTPAPPPPTTVPGRAVPPPCWPPGIAFPPGSKVGAGGGTPATMPPATRTTAPPVTVTPALPPPTTASAG